MKLHEALNYMQRNGIPFKGKLPKDLTLDDACEFLIYEALKRQRAQHAKERETFARLRDTKPKNILESIEDFFK